MKRFFRFALAVLAGLALLFATEGQASADFINLGAFNYIGNGNAGNQNPFPSAGNNSIGPEYIITINAAGTASIALNPFYRGADPGPYDGSDDVYIGVVNNYAGALLSISLSSSSLDLFNFDGDGIQSYHYDSRDLQTGTNGNSGGAAANDDYGGPDVTFTNISAANNYESGTVNFTGNGVSGIAGNGGTDYFSLEEAPSLVQISLGSIQSAAAPEPAAMAMAASGALMLFGYGWRRKRQTAPVTA